MVHKKYYEEYLHLLKMFKKYNNDTSNGLIFTFQTETHEKLTKLKEKYNLINISGKGNELSRILNLFNWLTKNIIHDGSQYPKGDRNALNILKQSIEDKQGVNCRMVAIAMNDIFLSMGFKSRYITCMPIGFDFKDCHVVNIVYSYELDKWVFLDASMGTYLWGEDGALLSLQELRDAIIEDKKIHMNEAYYNGELVEQQEYLKYMTKNLFAFESPSNYEFNYESKNNHKTFYYLMPHNYFTNNKIIKEDLNGNRRTEHYVTSSDEFWKKPI